MGRKKRDNAIGNSIIKDRFGVRKTKTEDSFLHTSELQDHAEWGRLNLQSVTEQSNLDDFLATAELAGTEFIAERQNIQIVGTPHHTGLPSTEQMKQTQAAEQENRKLLSIPRRPLWDETTTAEELDLMERTSFLDWRRQLARLQENEHLTLTPFERNLDFWRQLWRVIERSDVVVQIVDARNPLLFHCEDLELYVKEVGEHKVNVILINKADLLNDKQRASWAAYFDTIGLKAVFWSAVEETERCKLLEEAEKAALDADKDENEAGTDSDDDDDEDDDSEEESTEEDQIEPGAHSAENVKDTGSEKGPLTSTQSTTETPSQTLTEEAAEASVSGAVESTDSVSQTNSETPARDAEQCHNCGASGVSDTPAGGPVVDSAEQDRSAEGPGGQGSEGGGGAESAAAETQAEAEIREGLRNNPKLLTGDELITYLTSLYTQGTTYTEGITTLGLVGYPNVGKSSSINAILQSKKVPVSATPGRTKHFQTLYVDKTVLLCDCPGLVMPTFVSTKAEMVTSGILPIDQMRDHIPPVSLVCRYIPRQVLETTYGIILPPPGEGEDENRPPTAHELLSAYGYMRGFMTHKGIPDFSRSSRHILKDFMNGKLLYAHPPPGISPEEFQSAAPARKVVGVSLADHTGQARKSTAPQYANSVDRQFFTKTEVKMGVKGVKSAGGALGTTPARTEARVSGKKHFKHGKKEKLRRIHGHADY